MRWIEAELCIVGWLSGISLSLRVSPRPSSCFLPSTPFPSFFVRRIFFCADTLWLFFIWFSEPVRSLHKLHSFFALISTFLFTRYHYIDSILQNDTEHPYQSYLPHRANRSNPSPTTIASSASRPTIFIKHPRRLPQSFIPRPWSSTSPPTVLVVAIRHRSRSPPNLRLHHWRPPV